MYYSGQTEDNEIKKFLNALMECFLNLMDEARRQREAKKDDGTLSENVFRSLIRTYELVYNEVRDKQRNITVTEELDGTTRLDLYVAQKDTMFRNGCYLEIMRCIVNYLNKYVSNADKFQQASDRVQNETKIDQFLDSLPFLARVCKIARLRLWE